MLAFSTLRPWLSTAVGAVGVDVSGLLSGLCRWGSAVSPHFKKGGCAGGGWDVAMAASHPHSTHPLRTISNGLYWVL